MREALRRLAEALRAADHTVSPAELIDAGRVALACGPADRETLRLSLRAALAKSRAAQDCFDQQFDLVFDAGLGGAGRKKKKEKQQSGERGAGRAQDPQEGGAPRPPPQPRDRERAQRLRRRIEQRQDEEPRAHRLRLRLAEREAEQPGGKSAPSSWNLAEPATPELEARLVDELRRLVNRQRAIESRRRRPGRRGPIDVHAALRRNLACDGVPLVLPRRERRKKPPRLLLLVDVSYSAIRASGLFILAAAWLIDCFREARTLFFVDRPVDVTHTLRRWLDGRLDPPEPRARAGRAAATRRGATAGAGIRARVGQASFRALIEHLDGIDLGAPSDYGRVLEQTIKLWRPWLDRRSVVLLFGDGRTNRFPPCPWLLEQIGESVRRLVWLLPEPAERWGSGDSAFDHYLPAVDQACEATTLEGLLAGLTA